MGIAVFQELAVIGLQALPVARIVFRYFCMRLGDADGDRAYRRIECGSALQRQVAGRNDIACKQSEIVADPALIGALNEIKRIAQSDVAGLPGSDAVASRSGTQQLRNGSIGNDKAALTPVG